METRWPRWPCPSSGGAALPKRAARGPTQLPAPRVAFLQVRLQFYACAHIGLETSLRGKESSHARPLLRGRENKCTEITKAEKRGPGLSYAGTARTGPRLEPKRASGP